jgi:hypothetical protein
LKSCAAEKEANTMNNTMLRFYPCDENLDVHYTAVVLNEGLLQVKAPGQTGKQHFESVDAWLASLPGSPSIDALSIQCQSTKEPKEPVERRARSEKPKKIKWNVPSKSTARTIESVPWARYVYFMIKEANPELLKNTVIRDLYNELVSCLTSYAGHIVTRPPYFYKRYCLSNIQPNNGTDTVVGTLPQLFIQKRDLRSGNYQHTSSVYQQNLLHVLSVYQPLYEQIKFDVLPYMERRLHEKKAKERTRICNRLLERYNASLMKLTRKFEGQAQYLRYYINSFEKERASYEEPFQSAIKW